LKPAFPFIVAIAVVAAGACSKAPPSHDEGRKPRVDLTVWLGPKSDVPEDGLVVSTTEPPAGVTFFDKVDMKIAVVGVPVEGDPAPGLEKAISDVHVAKANAAIVVTKRCLRDLVPALRKNLLPFWVVAIVVGARCDGPPVESNLGAAALLEAGAASRVRITFDRRTRAFLKVEPLK
jgi:hypothetical protein